MLWVISAYNFFYQKVVCYGFGKVSHRVMTFLELRAYGIINGVSWTATNPETVCFHFYPGGSSARTHHLNGYILSNKPLLNSWGMKIWMITNTCQKTLRYTASCFNPLFNTCIPLALITSAAWIPLPNYFFWFLEQLVIPFCFTPVQKIPIKMSNWHSTWCIQCILGLSNPLFLPESLVK